MKGSSQVHEEGSAKNEEEPQGYYRRLRPGDPPTPRNARALIETPLFRCQTNVSDAGRYKINPESASRAAMSRILTKADLVLRPNTYFASKRAKARWMTSDHLGSRRVRRQLENAPNQMPCRLARKTAGQGTHDVVRPRRRIHVTAKVD